MMNQEKQRMVLELLKSRRLRVNEESGLIERWTGGWQTGEWKPAGLNYTGTRSDTPVIRITRDGRRYEFPASAVVKLAEIRKVLPTDVYIEYADGDPRNLTPTNLRLISKADYRRSLGERRHNKA